MCQHHLTIEHRTDTGTAELGTIELTTARRAAPEELEAGMIAARALCDLHHLAHGPQGSYLITWWDCGGPIDDGETYTPATREATSLERRLAADNLRLRAALGGYAQPSAFRARTSTDEQGRTVLTIAAGPQAAQAALKEPPACA